MARSLDQLKATLSGLAWWKRIVFLGAPAVCFAGVLALVFAANQADFAPLYAGMSPEDAQRVTYRRALEGELSRTIEQLSAVERSRVHLALPEKISFDEGQQHAKASITVKLKAGRSLSASEAGSIVHLVASSVPGLDSDHVTLVDSGGNLLVRPQPAGDGSSLAADHGAFATSLEARVKQQLVTLIEPIVGAGRVRINTSVELDYKSEERTQEVFEPDGKAIKSEQRTSERGQPGPARTRQGQAVKKGRAAAPAPGSPSTENESIQYEVSRTLTRTVHPTGTLKRISVAVVVDDAARLDKGASGEARVIHVSRTAEELGKIEELVRAAVGFDRDRGDRVVVENIPFDRSMAVLDRGMLEGSTDWLYWSRVLKLPFMLGVIALAALIVFRPLARTLGGLVSARPHGGALPAPREQGPPSREQEMQKALDLQLEGESAATGLRRTALLKKKISDFAQQEPDNMAQLIRSWIAE